MHHMLRTVSLIMMIAGSLFSCNQTKKMQQESNTAAVHPDMAAWNTHVDSYHEVMSTTFHPAENGDLKPLRTRATTLAERGEAWAKAAIPAHLNGKGLEAKLQLLAKGSRDIADLVAANASDETLTTAITALHDVFHEVVEMGSGH